MTDGSGRDPQWHKDAVSYQLHVKTFFDGDASAISPASCSDSTI